MWSKFASPDPRTRMRASSPVVAHVSASLEWVHVKSSRSSGGLGPRTVRMPAGTLKSSSPEHPPPEHQQTLYSPTTVATMPTQTELVIELAKSTRSPNGAVIVAS